MIRNSVNNFKVYSYLVRAAQRRLVFASHCLQLSAWSVLEVHFGKEFSILYKKKRPNSVASKALLIPKSSFKSLEDFTESLNPSINIWKMWMHLLSISEFYLCIKFVLQIEHAKMIREKLRPGQSVPEYSPTPHERIILEHAVSLLADIEIFVGLFERNMEPDLQLLDIPIARILLMQIE